MLHSICKFRYQYTLPRIGLKDRTFVVPVIASEKTALASKHLSFIVAKKN